jgi:dihydroorotase
MSRLLIRNGRVIDPASGLDEREDVLIADGVIERVGVQVDASDAEVFDAEGLIVAPGFIDLRARLREPGLEHAETIESGARAAAAGGFTVVCALPHTQPVNDSATVTSFLVDRAARQSHCTVMPIGAITHGVEGEQLAEIGSMKAAGAVAVCDGDSTVMSAALMRRAMRYAKSFDLTVMDHCEDANLAAGGSVHDGLLSAQLGLMGIPASAEETIVARDIILSGETGARFHAAHLSTEMAVELVRRAKDEGRPVTAEVAAHQFMLTANDVPGYDSNYKVQPPLRTRADADAIIEGLRDGTIDAIVSDHAPHTGNVKMQEFESCPSGITGLETAVGLAIEGLFHEAHLPINRVVELFTTGPAAVLGRTDMGRIEVGAAGRLTLLDLERSWEFTSERTQSMSRNSPFYEKKFRGGPAATINAGKVVWRA